MNKEIPIKLVQKNKAFNTKDREIKKKKNSIKLITKTDS